MWIDFFCLIFLQLCGHERDVEHSMESQETEDSAAVRTTIGVWRAMHRNITETNLLEELTPSCKLNSHVSFKCLLLSNILKNRLLVCMIVVTDYWWCLSKAVLLFSNGCYLGLCGGP
jgi:hypothetical protein